MDVMDGVTAVYEPVELERELAAALRIAGRRAHDAGYCVDSVFATFPGDPPGAAPRHLRYANGTWYEVTFAGCGDE